MPTKTFSELAPQDNLRKITKSSPDSAAQFNVMEPLLEGSQPKYSYVK